MVAATYLRPPTRGKFMHILVSLLGVLGMAIFILWRIQQAAYLAREVADVAGSAKGLFRRWRWRRKVNASPIDLIEDPREAASVLMIAVAQADGRISDTERQVIAHQIKKFFGASDGQAGALIAQSEWVVREGIDPSEVMRRLTPLLQKTTTSAQRGQLIAMLTATATADGIQDEMTVFDISRFAKQLSAGA